MSDRDVVNALLALEPEAAHRYAEFVQAVEIFALGAEAAVRAFREAAERSARVTEELIKWIHDNPPELFAGELDNHAANV